MPYTPRTRYRPDKADPAATLAGMRAKATTPEARARVEALGQRWGVGTEKAATGKSNTSRKRGTAVEGVFGGKGVSSVLRADGYAIVRSQDSKGAADVVGLKTLDAPADAPAARAVQAKRVGAFAANSLNDAIRRFLGRGTWQTPLRLAEGARREAWLYLDSRGWVARAYLAADDGLTVEGDEPYRTAVEASIRTMLARPDRAPKQRPMNTHHTAATFKERLTQ